jgi:glycosyltransferase involved in cell wall biosynthesis
MEAAAKLFPAPQFDLRLYPILTSGGLAGKLKTLLRPNSYLFSPAFTAAFNTELKRGFDILHLEHHWSGWMGLAHRERALLNLHYLFAEDLSEAPVKTFRESLNRRRTLSAERTLLRKYGFQRVLSSNLQSLAQRINPQADISVVPLGIDASLYPFVERKPAAQPTLLLTGSMSWYPTLSAAERLLNRLWPEIKRRVPAARLEIVGWNAREMLKPFTALPDVTITENAPSVEPYFQSATLLLYAPKHCSGVKVKVLESCLYGLPVVTTRDGVEGLPVEAGVHALVAQDDVGLVDNAVSLLNNPSLQDSLRTNARKLVEQHCAPAKTVGELEQVYAKMLAAAKTPSGPA